jgi:AhpD family alkylhydroperoxidase
VTAAIAPRVPLIDTGAAAPAVAAVFERARDGFGIVPNLYRTLGHAPELLEAWVDFAWPLRHAAVTSRLTRELVILRVALLDGIGYEWDHHVPMAKAAGATEEQVVALAAWRDAAAGVLADDQRAALALADRVAAGQPVADDEWAELSVHFDHRDCIELVLTASFYVCVGRVLSSLQVPGEDTLP